jgi:hypothetical protein
VCASWAPWSLTVQQKTKRKAISSEILTNFEDVGETFLSQIVTPVETWAHHFEVETNGNPWNGTILNLPSRKNSNSLCQQVRA